MRRNLIKLALYGVACLIIVSCGSGICPLGGCRVPQTTVTCASAYNYAEPTGVLDTTFNTTGIRNFSPGGGNNYITGSLALTSDCKILVGVNASTASKSYIYKINTDGTLDSTFGSSGSFLADTQQGGNFILKSNGKFINISVAANTYRFIQYNADGTLDASFSPPTIGLPAYNVMSRTAVLSDGSFLLMFDQKYVYKFTSTGNLDTSFATAGLLTTGLTTTGAYQRSGLLVDSSNRITVGGNDGTNFRMERYSSSGAIDTTFGTAGVTTTAVSGAATSHIVDFKILSSGKILAGGYDSLTPSASFCFARYDANGNADTTFGTAGSIAPGGGMNRHAWYYSNMQVDSTTGKIYMGDIDGGWSQWMIARYTSNGALDTTFATGGYLTRTDANGDGTGLLVTPWGKIIAVAGTTTIVKVFSIK